MDRLPHPIVVIASIVLLLVNDVLIDRAWVTNITSILASPSSGQQHRLIEP
jgi:hypothetical protein